MPAVVLRDGDELGERSGAIHADASRIWTKVAPAGEAIPAMSTGDVSFPDHEIARRESSDVAANRIDDSHKFVADGHRDWNSFLGPGVPIVNVNVRPADRGFDNTNEHVIAGDFWNRNFFEPQPGLGFAFHDGVHRFLHEAT